MRWLRRRRPGRHDAAAVRRVVPAQTSALPPWEQTGARVELGFRDGSTAALAPDSAQARALREIASVLTSRD
jgi:hypothetical protein